MRKVVVILLSRYCLQTEKYLLEEAKAQTSLSHIWLFPLGTDAQEIVPGLQRFY